MDFSDPWVRAHLVFLVLGCLALSLSLDLDNPTVWGIGLTAAAAVFSGLVLVRILRD